MPAKLEEITVIYRRERPACRWGDTCIIECDPIDQATGEAAPVQSSLSFNDLMQAEDAKRITVKLDCQPDELTQGLSYHLYGRWTTHARHGRQFIAKTFIRSQPHGRAGTIRYLMTTCAGHGVGLATAEKLWKRFQGDAVRILREQPDVAVAAVGLGHWTEEKAKAAAKELADEVALENTSIDLIDLLGGRGFPKTIAKAVVQEWGNTAAAKIRKNPYLLMRFRGCGFLRTDALYLELGGDPGRLKRQALCAWYAIARDTDGSTWHKPEVAESGIRGKIGGTSVDPIAAMILAKRAGMLTVHTDATGRKWIAESRKADNERTIAEHVCEMLKDPAVWPDIATLDVSDHQREELAKALGASLAIFAGSPGTGKTYSAARLIAAIMAAWGSDEVAVCAPTGKAAVRITEALEGYEIRKTATTIHRLLGVAQRTQGEGWGFVHDETNPLPFKFIVVDESSMIDTDLMASLLRACGPGTHVLLVGDIYQLPPVGHGAPLRDLIAAGVPCGELKKIERNWGAIVQACADIRDGRKWQTCEELDPDAGQNLKLIPAASGAKASDEISKLIHKLKSAGVVDPIWGVQVICAVNKKSELSRKDLNARLQRELNAGGQMAAGNPFKVNDKIVCLKNSWMPVVEDAGQEFNRDALDGKVFCANGELARVVGVAEKLTTARLDNPARLIKIPRGTDNNDGQGDGQGENGSGENSDDSAATSTGCQWDLAYAISCHKSQGSEFPVVIVALDEYPGARLICSREWIYTAISRAKLACFLVGKKMIAESMCLTRAISKRKTFLKELITEGMKSNGTA
jgi:exodeoxyribonuclease V alpha subunit